MSKFLDATGLTYFKGKIETLLSGKVDKVTGKGLSTNDYTTAEKTKLAGIDANANNYTHPSHTAKESGLYKVTVDSSGHVSAAAAVAKSDITALGIPGSDTTYSDATTTVHGLMSTTDKTKLDGIAENANNYSHPSYTAKAAGLYKVTVDASGHVSAATAVAKSDITGLGIPAQDTTYSAATTSAEGLMSSTDKTKLNGIAENANNYSHPSYTAKSAGLYKVTVDASGHVSATSAVAKSDITALGIPGSDTTYSTATGSTNGLMSSADKSKLDLFAAASSYALKTDIASMYKYKGSVAAVANLPSTGNVAGDVYNVEANEMNYAWTGTAWDSLGGIFSVDAITTSEIDAMFA